MHHFTTDEYIYCPWMAPIEIQRAAGCHVGTDYPNPIIDHATAGFLCCEKLRSVMDMVHQGPSSTRNSSRRPHLLQQRQYPGIPMCTRAVQTHLHRYHPYSHPQGTNHTLLSTSAADSLLNPTGRNDLSSESLGSTNCQQHTCSRDGGGSGRVNKECCTICSSSDNLMTQLLLHKRQEQDRTHEEISQSRKSSSSPPHRARRRSPPSLCSHKHSNFTVIA